MVLAIKDLYGGIITFTPQQRQSLLTMLSRGNPPEMTCGQIECCAVHGRQQCSRTGLKQRLLARKAQLDRSWFEQI